MTSPHLWDGWVGARVGPASTFCLKSHSSKGSYPNVFGRHANSTGSSLFCERLCGPFVSYCCFYILLTLHLCGVIFFGSQFRILVSTFHHLKDIGDVKCCVKTQVESFWTNFRKKVHWSSTIHTKETTQVFCLFRVESTMCPTNPRSSLRRTQTSAKLPTSCLMFFTSSLKTGLRPLWRLHGLTLISRQLTQQASFPRAYQNCSQVNTILHLALLWAHEVSQHK